jgi:integrase
MRGQGRLFRRTHSSSWWVSYYHHGREIRESAKTTSEHKARALLRERLRTAGTQEFIGPAAQRVTFEDLAALYLTDYKLNGRRSARDAARNVAKLRGAFGIDRALDITTDRIAAYTERRLEAGLKPASVNRELAALRRMFTLAIRAGKIATRPHIALLAEDNAREGFLEPADFATLGAHLAAWLLDAALFAYLTGWRKGEVATLTWADVDLRSGVIRLRAAHSKNKRPRVVILRGELRALIERRASARRLDCPLVFHRDGQPIGDFREAWRAACAAAGLTGLLFHDMRRSAIRNMVRAGVPERVAMAVSGHRTRSVFDRYNIVSEADLAAAAEQTLAYVEAKREAPATVASLAAVRDGRRVVQSELRGQNTDSEADSTVAQGAAGSVRS